SKNAEQNHAGNPTAAWRSEAGKDLGAIDESWAHARQRAFAGGDGVGRTGAQAVGIAAVQVGGEVVHFVIEQYAGARHGEGRAKHHVQRQGGGHRVAFGVHDGEMGGVIAFAPGGGGR